MLENEKSRKLVETIINIARTMEMYVVAEGIETEEQRAVLTELGCDYCRVSVRQTFACRTDPWLLLQINSQKQIIPIGKIHSESAFVSQKSCYTGLTGVWFRGVHASRFRRDRQAYCADVQEFLMSQNYFDALNVIKTPCG